MKCTDNYFGTKQAEDSILFPRLLSRKVFLIVIEYVNST